MNAHERGFLNFLAQPGRDRMERLLEMGEKRRSKVRDLLYHAIVLDPRYRTRMQGAEDNPGHIERLLRDLGAPVDCHLIAADIDHDGRDLSLADALATTSSDGAAFISCIPGRLGFFRYDENKAGYLLRKPSA